MHNCNYRQCTGAPQSPHLRVYNSSGQLKLEQPVHKCPVKCKRVFVGWAKKSQKALKQMRKETHLPTPQRLCSQRIQPTICCVSGPVLTSWSLSLPTHNLPAKLSRTRLRFNWQPHLQYSWWLARRNKHTGNYFTSRTNKAISNYPACLLFLSDFNWTWLRNEHNKIPQSLNNRGEMGRLVITVSLLL